MQRYLSVNEEDARQLHQVVLGNPAE